MALRTPALRQRFQAVLVGVEQAFTQQGQGVVTEDERLREKGATSTFETCSVEGAVDREACTLGRWQVKVRTVAAQRFVHGLHGIEAVGCVTHDAVKVTRERAVLAQDTSDVLEVQADLVVHPLGVAGRVTGTGRKEAQAEEDAKRTLATLAEAAL